MGAASSSLTLSLDGGGLKTGTSNAFTLTVSSHTPTVILWNGPGAGASMPTDVP